ncbi:MAG: hypothetical protein IV093_14230 [Rubrivivax sp.]|nr:hypothetical protein [Rubrivivax sp.]
MGFGASTPTTTLGQPLDFSVGLRLDPGEELNPECVRAEVSIGDVGVPAAGVGASLLVDANGRSSIRVRTLARIDEPVVAVQVAAGCPQRLVRRFVVFADPPVMVAVPVAAEAVPAVAATVPPPAALPAAALPETRVALVAQTPPPGPPAAASGPPRRAAPVQRRPTPAARAAAPAPRPRLKLDAAPPPPPPPAAASAPLPAPVMDVVEQANQAVLAAIAAASASQGRMAALEASVRQLGDEALAQKAVVDTLRQRAVAAEGRNQWVLPLGLALLALLGLAGWLWLRLRELERDRRHGWLSAARAPAPAPSAAAAAVPPSPSQVPLLVERSVRTTGAASLGAGLAPVHVPTPSELPDPPSTTPQDWGPETATLKTQPLLTSAALVQPENRDVSAEELIDLEQQAEFFVVLGQDDAAIDLLVSHLRDSGGASPLPYLKLLDIYRRLGDRGAYERTRDRFNHRFNAHVPGWDAPTGDGRMLEDYPQVMGWLQQVWPKPLDAMAELESLLFRKDGGELFELPAYRELLMLYALARDLLDGDTGSAGSAVDVLLPLNDSPGFAPTSPRPYFGEDGTIPIEHQPTAPIDLDLDLPAEPPPSAYGRFR